MQDEDERPVCSDGTLAATRETYEALKDKPESELTREELRVKRYYEKQEKRKAETAKRRELAKIQKQQDEDYPRLKPEEWKAKYGTDKPKRGLIDEATAVKIVSRRMTAMALHTLASVCEMSKNDNARVSAAKEILDRGWGKAHLQAEAETRPGSDITITFGNQKLLDQATSHETFDEDEIVDAEAEEADI